MKRMTRYAVAVLIAALLPAGAAQAQQSWYDHYDAGLVAIRRGDWSTALDRMNKAIAGNAKESNRARTYGNIFINYHPFYYRGVANLNLGNYQQAITDLETTTGPGPENLGSIGELLQSAKTKAASTQATSVPVPVPDPQPARPTVVPAPVPPPQPVVPVIDAALQARAENAVQAAQARVRAAQERNATETAQYREALQGVRDANSRLARARSNEDLREIIALADNAALTADSATAALATTTGGRTSETASVVLADSARRVRLALEYYFRGDFDDAAREFTRLTQEMPRNGWIWAFLGASQYSQYAFEADEQYRTQALEAFRKARAYGKWGRDGLPSKYFSRRIRNAFNQTAG